MPIITIPFKGIRYKGEHTPAVEYSLNNVVSHPSTGVKYIAYAFDVPAQISITDISYWKFYDDGNVQIATQVADNTSAIAGMIESGSNANGNWTKFSDGTLIQSARHIMSLPYDRGGSLVILPTLFVGGWVATVTPAVQSSTGEIMATYETFNKTASSFHIKGVTNGIGIGSDLGLYIVDYIAIGRWK